MDQIYMPTYLLTKYLLVLWEGIFFLRVGSSSLAMEGCNSAFIRENTLEPKLSTALYFKNKK
jgi:hypothetical protein